MAWMFLTCWPDWSKIDADAFVTAVGHAFIPRGGIDSCNPQFSEFPLPGPPISVGISPRTVYRFCRAPNKRAATAPIPLRGL